MMIRKPVVSGQFYPESQSQLKTSVGELIDKGVKEHFDKQVNKIETQKDFKHFLMHYQSILAYDKYYAFEKKSIKNKFYRQSHGGRK